MPKAFDLDAYPWKKTIDYAKNPESYRVGKGEQGVLICEPYKSEILPFWQFKTPDLAKKSATKIHQLFLAYVKDENFVGADMARKFLQMGFTRARRYANYQGGKKYAADHTQLPLGTGDPQKIISAEIFYQKWQKAEANRHYKKMKLAWKTAFG